MNPDYVPKKKGFSADTDDITVKVPETIRLTDAEWELKEAQLALESSKGEKEKIENAKLVKQKHVALDQVVLTGNALDAMEEIAVAELELTNATKKNDKVKIELKVKQKMAALARVKRNVAQRFGVAEWGDDKVSVRRKLHVVQVLVLVYVPARTTATF